MPTPPGHRTPSSEEKGKTQVREGGKDDVRIDTVVRDDVTIDTVVRVETHPGGPQPRELVRQQWLSLIRMTHQATFGV